MLSPRVLFSFPWPCRRWYSPKHKVVVWTILLPFLVILNISWPCLFITIRKKSILGAIKGRKSNWISKVDIRWHQICVNSRDKNPCWGYIDWITSRDLDLNRIVWYQFQLHLSPTFNQGCAIALFWVDFNIAYLSNTNILIAVWRLVWS